MSLENGYLLRKRYRILDILGQGGMGAVYRALDENLDIIVAIKENAFFTQEYARQFQREAKILAATRHPNLPRVFDYFVIAEEGQYLVMDFIEGEDLRQWISRGDELTENQVLQIGLAISDALIYLHSRQPAITHRDIKPGNIKITPDGEVILVDFGLVKLHSDTELTTTAARAMTPGYSPPEQYGDTPTDHRSDLFSLGATLYTALAGYLPEDSLARTTGKKELTPLRFYAPQLSSKTVMAIEKALKLRFEDRWQSAAAFKAALQDAWEQLPQKSDSLSYEPAAKNKPDPALASGNFIHEITETTRTRLIHETKDGRKIIDTIWLTIGVIIFVLLIILGASLSVSDNLFNVFSLPILEEPGQAQLLLSPQEPTPIFTPGMWPTSVPANAGGDPENGLLSPTPTGGGAGMIAYVSERSGEPQIWILDVATRDTYQVTQLDDGACQPDWHPDGSQVVFTTPCPSKRARYPGSRLMIIELETGHLIPLPPSLEGDFGPAWSPDGEWIAYTTLINGQMQLAKINPEAQTIIRLSDGSFDDSSPAWSPDGSQLTFARIRGVSQIWIKDADGQNAVQFARTGIIDNFNPAWSPDGSLILFSQPLGLESPNKQLFGMRLEDLGKEEAYRILPRIRLDYVPLMDYVDVSPDGQWLAFEYWFSDVLSDIYIMAFPGANLTQLTDHPAMDYQPVWRPLPE